MNELKPCPFCGLDDQRINRNSNIFHGQTYSDRYPKQIGEQNHGFNIRCEGCGNQTCYWHLENEAANAWNTRIQTNEWISVEDRLPEQGDRVLIMLDDETDEIGYQTAIYDDDFYFADIEDGMYDRENVTHWKPIEPPMDRS